MKYSYVGRVTISQEKMIETISKRMQKLGLVNTDNIYHLTASARLMPDFIGPRAHNDHRTIFRSSLEH